MQRSLSFENQWEQTVNDINQLVHVHVNEPCEVDRYKGRSYLATRAFSAKKCANQACQTHFGLFEWPQNCHRCGASFCKQCTSYERRLNSNGNFDPAGRLFKVCETCFGVSHQSLGITVSHFSLFRQMRNQCETAKHQLVMRTGLALSLNFERECHRLCDGFMGSLQKLRIGQTISDVFGVAKPDWEKSPGLLVKLEPSTGFPKEKLLGLLEMNCLQTENPCIAKQLEPTESNH